MASMNDADNDAIFGKNLTLPTAKTPMTDHTPTPPSPDWRALCKELREAYVESQTIQHGPLRSLYYGPCSLLARVDAALATLPAVDEDERLRLVTAGISSGYIAGHEATVDGHYTDPDEVAAEMAPMVLTEVDATTPPAATREAGPLPQAPTLRTLLLSAYETGDGSAHDAQFVDGEWWHPVLGCRSLQKVMGSAVSPLMGLPFWIERCQQLQRENRRFREPERTILFDILANGTLLPDPEGKRYGLPQAEISDEEWELLRDRLWSENHKVDADGDQYMTYLGYEEVLYEARTELARLGGKAVRPVAESERPWERPNWLDAEGRCWVGHPLTMYELGETGEAEEIPAEWLLIEPGSCPAHWRVVMLPHWALPAPCADKGEVK
jgi:hypothetical protein